jgi:hypothetical protein
VAEADGNRTRLRTLARTPVLKFGDGRVGLCYLVLPGVIQYRSARPFVPSGVALSHLVMSWMFATCLQATQARSDDFCRHRLPSPRIRDYEIQESVAPEARTGSRR